MTRSRAPVALTILLAACSSGNSGGDVEAESRAVPISQSAAARALRLPRMKPARVAQPDATAPAATIRVLVTFEGTLPADTTVQARTIDPACSESFVDTAVVHNGAAVAGALVWVEGDASVFSTTGDGEHRPTVVLEQCRLLPRVQLASPGSTVQLVMHDARVERLVVVPASLRTPIDTIAFNTDGQLVPLRNRADSAGVLGIYSTRLPWARAFIAIAPAGVSAISDANGVASFSVDRRATKVTVRAWHPSLGVVAGSVNPSRAGAEPTITLTFRR